MTAFLCMLAVSVSPMLQLVSPLAAGAQVSGYHPGEPTLRTAIKAAEQPTHGIVLAVDAEWTQLPAGATAPQPGCSLDEAAAPYGWTARTFGAVTVIAPKTMVLLNPDPGDPNINRNIPANDAWTMLISTLTDDEWKSLVSQTGLLVSSLNDTQVDLFRDLLPDGMLTIVPVSDGFSGYSPSDVQDLTTEIPTARIRLSQTFSATVFVKRPNGLLGYMLDSTPGAMSASTYRLTNRESDYGDSATGLYGQQVSTEVPNELKTGDLRLDDAALGVIVPLDGLATVGDLVARIGDVTHLELYADKRIEHKTLTLLPAPPDSGARASAVDLLTALEFRVTGVWRQVGPAYVLTDDQIGLGTRKQRWFEFEEIADRLRGGPVEAAAESNLQRFSLSDVSWFDDPLAPSPDQLAPKPGFAMPDPLVPAGLTMVAINTLTQGQQDYIRSGYANLEQMFSRGDDPLPPLTSDMQVDLGPRLQLSLIIPSIADPIDMSLKAPVSALFRHKMAPLPTAAASGGGAAFSTRDYLLAHPDQLARLRKTNPDLAELYVPTGTSPAPSMHDVLALFPRRAALIRAKTAQEAADRISALKKLGFTEVWLVVFENGVARLSGSSLSPAEALAKGHDILDSAIQAGQSTGMSVYPVLNLLTWGPSPPDAVCDCNIVGDTSALARARFDRINTLPPATNYGPLTIPDPPIPARGVAVNPMAPRVADALGGLVKDAAGRAGIAGIVWRETAPPGYGPTTRWDGASPLTLGFQEDMRLAFLRKDHVDPVDMIFPNVYRGKAKTEVPEMTDWSNVMPAVADDWAQFKKDANVALLRRLYALAKPASLPGRSALQILVKQRGSGRDTGVDIPTSGWYGSWDDPTAMPPEFDSANDASHTGTFTVPREDLASQQHRQSRTVILALTLREVGEMRDNTRMAVYRAKHNPVDGIVVDLTGDDIDETADPITQLAAKLIDKPSPAVTPSTATPQPAASDLSSTK